jgi:mRNA interferase HicA
MKRADLIRLIEQGGCVLVRHGGKHDWCRNLATGVSQPVPRHREIKEPLDQAAQLPHASDLER